MSTKWRDEQSNSDAWLDEKMESDLWNVETDNKTEWLGEGSLEKATISASEYAQQAKQEAYAARDVVLYARLEVSTNKAAVLEAVEVANSSMDKGW